VQRLRAAEQIPAEATCTSAISPLMAVWIGSTWGINPQQPNMPLKYLHGPWSKINSKKKVAVSGKYTSYMGMQ